MTRDDIVRMAREAGLNLYVNDVTEEPYSVIVERFAALVAAAERGVLEAELLKLRKDIGGPTQYIQGRWDLIGEFQDVIRARGETK